jgi:hypothetical protein
MKENSLQLRKEIESLKNKNTQLKSSIEKVFSAVSTTSDIGYSDVNSEETLENLIGLFSKKKSK